jgi:hypothetical protein
MSYKGFKSETLFKKGALFSKESVILRGPLFKKPILGNKTNVINRLDYHDLQYARVYLPAKI